MSRLIPNQPTWCKDELWPMARFARQQNARGHRLTHSTRPFFVGLCSPCVV
uniref:Uncharacterized protein n=1 Tax=Arundo donax TaxID=35708 RepID=A0A0A9C3H3_ARUDO